MSSENQYKDNDKQDTDMEASLMDEVPVTKSNKNNLLNTNKGKGLIVAGITGAFIAGMGLAQILGKNTASTGQKYLRNAITNLSSSTYVPNVNQITYGFNIVKSNPVNLDQNNFYTGTTGTPVFNITYTDSNEIEGYSVPDGYELEFLAGQECSFEVSSNIFSGMTSYVTWLSSLAYFDQSDNFGVGFGANLTTKNYRKLFYQKHASVKVSSMMCEIYSTTVNEFQLPPPSKSMINALDYLSNSSLTDADLQAFYDSVGTHFQYKTGMGAAYFESQVYSDVDTALMHIYDNYWSSSTTSDKIKYAYDDKSYVTSLDEKSAQRYATEQVNSDYNSDSMVVGTSPMGLTSADQWAKNSAIDPVPVQFELAPLYDLIGSGWLKTQYPQKSLSSSQLSSIASALKTYAPKYCLDIAKTHSIDNSVSFCRVPEPDPIYGLGNPITQYIEANVNGYWGPILMTPQSDFSTWYLMAQQGNNYVQGICVENAAHGRDCYPTESNGFQAHPPKGVQVDGPLVGLNVMVNNESINTNEQIHDIQFIYIDKDGKKATTEWAINYDLDLQKDYDSNDSSESAEINEAEDVGKLWSIINYTVDDGYIVGMSAFWSTYSLIMNLATYNVVYK